MTHKNDRETGADGTFKKSKVIDYATVFIPTDLDPKAYNFKQRRREILELIVQAGHPRNVSQHDLAKRYNVSQSQISFDYSALAEYLKEQVGNTPYLVAESVFGKALSDSMKKGDYGAAMQVFKVWTDWLFNTGKIEKTPEKIETDNKLEVIIKRMSPKKEEKPPDGNAGSNTTPISG